MEIFNPSEWKKINNTHGDEAKKAVESIREKNNIQNPPFVTKTPQRKFTKPILLSSTKVNALFGGGFAPGTIYLLYGEYATGKTQIGLHSCVSVYNLYKNLKTPVSALIIDTEDTVRPERIQEIAETSYDLPDSQVLSRIRIVHSPSTEAIHTQLKKIDTQGLDAEIKLIIIDSLTNFIRVDLGNDEVSNIQVRDKLKRILIYLREITKKHNTVTILTSQVTGFTSERSIFPNRPIMEFVLNHYVDEVIFLAKEGDFRRAHVVNSKNVANKNAPFRISSGGIIDS